MLRTLTLACTALSLTPIAHAEDATEAEITARIENLSQSMHCPDTDNVPIAECDTSWGELTRTTIDALVRAGNSDADIIGYYQTRYGSEVVPEALAESIAE